MTNKKIKIKESEVLDYESDASLIQKYLNGNEESLKELINRYLKVIYNFNYQYVLNSAEAEDLTQETFLKIWKNLKKFDQSKNFKTWILTIAKNTCFDFLRKKNPQILDFENEEIKNFLENIPSEDKPIQIKIDNEILIQKVYKNLEILPVKYKTVILMHYIEDLSLNEIAEILDEPLNTIKSRLRRGILYLKNKIN
ncbi:MAG: RNA polymerase sigma factor [Minisyncoccia bacterium]